LLLSNNEYTFLNYNNTKKKTPRILPDFFFISRLLAQDDPFSIVWFLLPKQNFSFVVTLQDGLAYGDLGLCFVELGFVHGLQIECFVMSIPFSLSARHAPSWLRNLSKTPLLSSTTQEGCKDDTGTCHML